MDIRKLKKLFNDKNKKRTENDLEIKKFEVFDSLNAHEAAIIERNLYLRNYKTGERIVKEGDAAVVLYFLSSGAARVVKSAGSKQVELATLSSGSFFGEISLIDDQKRSATVIAVEPSRILCLFQPDFSRILSNHPSICIKFLDNFTGMLLHRIDHMKAEIRRISGDQLKTN